MILSCCDCAAGVRDLARLTHLEGIVGMQMALPMIPAAVFDKAVLEALAAGMTIDICVLAGRSQMVRALQNNPVVSDREIERRPEWAAPILFSTIPTPRHRYTPVPGGLYRLGLDEEKLGAVARQVGVHPLPAFLSAWIGRSREVDLAPFQIGRWPVTNHEYRDYLERSPSVSRLPVGFESQAHGVRLNGLEPSVPVVGVTWEEADAFCRWRGGRLPTADEWEASARGWEPRIFPWGNGFDHDRCSAFAGRSGGPEPVCLHPDGASSFGAEDLCGNVWEWTATTVIDDQRRRRRVVVGGSWRSPAILTLPSLRSPRDLGAHYLDVGFRCVL